MKIIQRIFILFFFLFCGVLGVLTIDNHVKTSQTEKRTLTTFPTLKLKNFFHTEYLSQISDAYSDQFQFRENLVEDYFELLQDGLQQDYLGTTVIGKDGYLFREPEIITNWKAYEKELKQYALLINEKAKLMKETNGCQLIYVNYPKKDVVMKKYLPDWYPDSSVSYKKAMQIIKQYLSKDVILVDAYDVFQKNGIENQCYYISDHHVNEVGQEAVYKEILSIINKKDAVNEHTLDEYSMEKVKMEGSFDSQIGNVLLDEKQDENLITKYNGNIKITCWNNGRKTNDSLFQNKNDYTRYMGGDKRETVIKTDNDTNLNVMMMGSSYTNLLECLMIPSVKNFVSIDYRYGVKGKDIRYYLKKYNPQYCILTPNQSNKMFSYDALKIHVEGKGE